MILEFEIVDLITPPTERKLNINRSIVVFNIKTSDKTISLNTGDVFTYENQIYEIMNRENIDSPDNYVKFNCLRKTVETQIGN
jgi:hypothetical protein